MRNRKPEQIILKDGDLIDGERDHIRKNMMSTKMVDYTQQADDEGYG